MSLLNLTIDIAVPSFSEQERIIGRHLMAFYTSMKKFEQEAEAEFKQVICLEQTIKDLSVMMEEHAKNECALAIGNLHKK